MANFFDAWLKGANARKLHDEWKEDQELKKELKGIAQASPESYDGFSYDQGTEIERMSREGGVSWDAQRGAYFSENDGQLVSPTRQHTFGGLRQPQPLTPEQVSDERLNMRATAYRKHGKDDAADRMEMQSLQRAGMRQARELGNLQIEKGKYDVRAAARAEDAAAQEAALMKEFQADFDLIRQGDYSPVANALERFNTDPNFADGNFAGVMNTPQGPVINIFSAKGQQLRAVPITPDSAIKVLNKMYMMRRAALTPGGLKDYATFQQTEESNASLDTYRRDTVREHGLDRASRESEGAANRANNLAVANKYASARTDGNEVHITPEQKKAFAVLADAYKKAETPVEQARIGRELSILQAEIAMGNKRFPSLAGIQNPGRMDMVKLREEQPDGTILERYVPADMAGGMSPTERALLPRGGGQGVGGLSAVRPKSAREIIPTQDVTRPQEMTRMMPDPVTGGLISEQEYYRKYRELPDQGLAGGIMNRFMYGR